ncbi:hypothetical protein H257_01549 [Aphanomyces astaci]|uniref:Ribosome biogenesis protein SLX9 n=1 Tax=Aphanomyces astaci TaxID=112090 RepID=W4H8K8_APHAT|nr:hypothetical protein H257_01549 [Aphanomyces astaci]ETV88252.1 hypothetical protein H257_01549 [Aphanomyces astaci]KAF0718263.1 hypothetical protein AaE_010684 [Aphanomyces astaci]RHX96650.1 hypothetical protein DYB36_001301 [Aphanomyces astaci]RHY37517.1 hypothetical protein DYB25_000118 [Aphanomyces astaci]RHY37552.1 hypothetical protein DYB38_002098 [Aphanomyces astaci]|eukprot:XP_009823115.1 hypothetical protein H257_01549 [Aphanomyces astaci]
MGKVRKSKTYRQHQPAVPVIKKAKDVEEEEAPEDKEDEAINALSRGQRKRQKRRDAFNKKMGMVERTILQKKKDAKKESDGIFGDFEDLQKSLFSETTVPATTADAAPKAPTKLTGKQKKRLAIHELGHLKAVHSHPSFQANPFAAIQMHLQNTVVAAQAPVAAPSKANKK